jgi:hypothetical protein
MGAEMTFESWWSENRDGAFFSEEEMVQEAWQAAQAAELERSLILKRALDELLSAKQNSEQGAGWDHSRAQRVWREAAEAVSKYESSDTQSTNDCNVMTFDDFWEIKGGGCTYDTGKYIWDEAQSAERERISELVRTMGGPEAVELLEKINES